jgi:FimV-like protein
MILIAANQQAQATRYARANEQYFKALADQALEDKQVFFSHFARGRPELSPQQSGLSGSAVAAPTPQATMPRADSRERAEPAMAGTAATDAPMTTSPPARPKVRVIADMPAEASNGKTSALGVHQAENSAELVANPRAEQPAQPSPRVGRTKVDRQKLDLASVYMTMGDLATAKILAKEILASGMTDLYAEAQGILQSIEEIESA